MRTLNSDEIEEVDEIMRERHPLYYSYTSITDIFPSLKTLCCCFYRKKQRILPAEIERSDTQQYQSREKKLGFGIVAYFDLHIYLLGLFLMIFILLLPSLYLFRYYPHGRKIGSSFLNKYSVGNLGFASVLCKDTSLKVGNLTMSCPTGEMREIISFGLIPRDAIQNDACHANFETNQCQSSYDQDSLQAEITQKCLNKTV